jgi:small redox-active disulfide protein 2
MEDEPMLSIKVLGPGCANCDRMMELAENAVSDILSENPDLEVALEKITDTMKFIDYGLLSTPGLVVNGELVSEGRVPSQSEVSTLIRQALG